MVHRNWKQELQDVRPTDSPRRRRIWILALLIAVLLAALGCGLWVWPGWLKAPPAPVSEPGAEELYLSATPVVLPSESGEC